MSSILKVDQIQNTDGQSALVIASDGSVDSVKYAEESNPSGRTITSTTMSSYEEGTWVPSLSGATGEAYGTRVGLYTKIGNQVACEFYMQLTGAPTGGGNAYIELPFTPNGSISGIHGGNLMRYDGMNLTDRAELFISPSNGSNNAYIYRGDGTVYSSISDFKIGVISAAFTYTAAS